MDFYILPKNGYIFVCVYYAKYIDFNIEADSYNMYYCCTCFSLLVGTKSSYRKKRRIKFFLMDICFCIDIFALFIEK